MKSLRVLFVTCICLFLISSVSATDNSFKLDFDGDGRTDLALYREGSRDVNIAPQPSNWYFMNAVTGAWGGVHWGRTLDIPAPADYDGDGKTDFGIYRWWEFGVGDANEYWLSHSTGSTNGYEVLVYEWEPGYYKFPRNYVGDARAEMAQLYRINVSQDPSQPCFMSVYFVGDNLNSTIRKTVGDACNVAPIPVPGDYNNDGYSDIAVFNNHTFRVWFPPYTSDSQPAMTEVLDIDYPVPGDYDGDGKTDFAGTKAADGRLYWIIKQSSNGATEVHNFGFATDKPVAGDYDGDGKTDLAVYRPSDTSWWIIFSSSGALFFKQFGLPTDTPLALPVIPFDPS